MLFEGVYRRFQNLNGGKGPSDARMTFAESLAVAQVEPANLEMTRAGKRFLLGNSAAITGIANSTTLPTTSAQWVLCNNSSTKTIFFEEIGMYLTSGTPGVGGILIAAICRSPAQVGATYTGTSISQAGNAVGNANSSLIVKASITITEPAAPNWYCIAENPSPNVTAFAASTFLVNRTLAGALAIRPGQMLALAVVAPAGTSPLFAPFARFLELESDME